MGRRWMVVEIDEGSVHAVLHTALHRVPRQITVSAATAGRLARSGVPFVVREGTT